MIQTMKKTDGYAPFLIKTKDEADLAATAARLLVENLREIPEPLVILPTGNTPLGMYRHLAQNYAGEKFWKNFRYLALDEYIGLEPGDSRLFGSWVNNELLRHVAVPQSHRITFTSNANDPAAECARMEEFLALNGPVDIAVLGLGVNGHIGFNEPGSAFNSGVRVVDLAPETVTANAKYWGGEQHVPRTAFTLGLGNLSTAARTMMLVSGAHKRDILKASLNDEISTQNPATYLRTIPNVKIIADEKALKTTDEHG